MKAEINGIKLEGTPKEIHEFIKLNEVNGKKPIDIDWGKIIKNNPHPYHPNTQYFSSLG
jgi:hypothetical protein